MRPYGCLVGAVLAAASTAWAAEEGTAIARSVAVDQVGYPAPLPKYAFAREPADSFVVIDAAAQTVLFRASMDLWKSPDPATGRSVYRGDFSAFRQPGRYRLVTSRGDTSSAFSISDTVYGPVYRSALKGFTYQRCGTQLSAAVAGVYQHPACHLLDGVYHSSTDTSGFHAASGGWHDAGDYGKYIVNAGISVGTLLLAYEMWPERFAQDNVGIAESGNHVPDILDEARYELEWFLRMQHTDGGFWFKVTREQFEGFIMPQNDAGARYIYTLSSAATGDAAACLARAARIFQAYDQPFAETCRQASVRAWDYLTVHWSIVPPGGFTNPSGTSTGEYGDDDDADERLWAAAELFETTGEETYHSYFQSSYIFGPLFGAAMWWGDVRPLALLTYLRSAQPAAVGSVKAELDAALTTYCNSQVSRRNASATIRRTSHGYAEAAAASGKELCTCQVS